MNDIKNEISELLDDLISINDACELLKCNRPTLYRLIKAGKIESKKISLKKSMVSLESIRNYIKGESEGENENE